MYLLPLMAKIKRLKQARIDFLNCRLYRDGWTTSSVFRVNLTHLKPTDYHRFDSNTRVILLSKQKKNITNTSARLPPYL